MAHRHMKGTNAVLCVRENYQKNSRGLHSMLPRLYSWLQMHDRGPLNKRPGSRRAEDQDCLGTSQN